MSSSSSEKHPLNDLVALSLQLNRQAFALPPIDGWLNSFLSMLLERLAAGVIAGIQVTRVIGNYAVPMASAGTVPTESADGHALDDASPIVIALKTRRTTMTENSRIYPILRGEDLVGVLIAYLFKPGDILGKTNDSMISSLALQLGPALSQSLRPALPQTGRLSRQVDMMRSLYEATRSFNTTLESVEISNQAAHSLVEMLKIDHVSIYVIEGGMAEVIAEHPDNRHVGIKVQLRDFPAYDSITHDQRPIIIESMDDTTQLGENRPVYQGLGVKAMALLPMAVQAEMIGMVSLDVYYTPSNFTPDQIDNAVAITEQLAVSVRNSQIYDQIRTRAQQLERITELSRQVTSTFDRDRIFQIVQTETQKLIRTDQISVALRQPDHPMLELYVLGDGQPDIHEFLYEQTALRFVCNTAEPLVLDDISGSDYPDYRYLSETGMRGAVIVPLVIGGQAIGTFNVMGKEAGVYSSLDLAVLEQIGHQLAIALENARLYAQTVQRVEAERLMNRLSGGIQGSGDLSGMLLSTVQEMAEALGARRARIRLQMPALNQESPRLASSKLLEKLTEKREP
ncbi:MAG TPA: GAF domain-containing protein [Aggregatilineales bacterium]|nr:GAF domain-containing protein [Aggregatilineales bacterium]